MPSLLDPLTIGPVTAPNRIVFGPHETNLGRGRSISERHVAYYGRRAAGGAGVIVVEEASVHPSDWPMERAPLASECGPGWSAVVDACAPHGTVVLAAIGHSGGQGTSHWSQRELWAPSRVPEVNTREVPKWMESDDIAAVIDGFAAAAGLAVDAGCAGVEINAGQFSLVRQFLSGLTNQRDDEWGRDRGRFARRVLAAVRSRIGPDAVVALRLSCDELAPWAGITPEAAPGVAVELISGGSDDGAPEAAPARVDLLTVVRGSIFSIGATRPDGHTPPGFNIDLAAAVRAAVRDAVDHPVAVVVQGSIVDIGQAQAALTGGAADAVEMTRAQIADAELASKLGAGVPERIRPCVLCNQTCQVRDNRNPIVTCVVDPRSGHETEDPPEPVGVAIGQRSERRGGDRGRRGSLLVVGGGVAGLEAARVAAASGHDVTVLERSERVGGAARSTARLPGRDRFALFADWLEAECVRSGVRIRTGVHAEASTVVDSLAGVDGASAHHVVLATGSRPGRRDVDVDDDAVTVLDPADVLADPAAVPAGAVMVWDPIGGPLGVGVAELLAAAGRDVHIATPDQIVGNELARAGDLGPANARLAQAGVTMHRRSVLRTVGAEGVSLEDRFSGQVARHDVGSVVDAGHRLPEDDLANEVAGLGPGRVVVVGDAVAPRTVAEAVLEGRRAGVELD
ncbi:MAG: mycofactocin system FadH/OYE family oxidoreductase 1 [Actinobacteria bacterium]|nr:mycofactocin system FadH/OYE family oxidoreductase 1 [Actinomycetota bacterium]